MDSWLTAVIESMRYISFVLIVLALSLDLYHQEGNQLKRLFYVVCLVGAIASYDTAMKAGTAIFDGIQDRTQEKVDTMYSSVEINLKDCAKNTGLISCWLDRNILIPMASTLLGLCKWIPWVTSIIQMALMTIFRALAPLVFGLAAWRPCIGTGVKFVVASLWLCMWKLGQTLVDAIITNILSDIMGQSVWTKGAVAAAALGLKGAAASAATNPALLIGLIVLLIVFFVVMFMLYILVPFMMYSLMSGGDLVHSATHALQGSFGAGMHTGQAIMHKGEQAGKAIAGAMAGGAGAGAGAGGEAAAAGESGGGIPMASTGGGSGGDGGKKSVYAKMAETADRQMSSGKA